MKLKDEGRFQYAGGTTLSMRLWEDEKGIDKPVVLVEVEKGYGVSSNQIRLATDVAKSLGKTPDKINWYEQSPNGDIKEVVFRPYQSEFRPHDYDSSVHESRKVEKEGKLKPEIHTGYTPREKALSNEEKKELQTKVGERLESFEERQNREFDQLNYRFLSKSI